MSDHLSKGDRVLIAPNARMHREIDKRGVPRDNGWLPTYADERGTVESVEVVVNLVPPSGVAFYRPSYGAHGDWVLVRLDHVTYPEDKPLEMAWIREQSLTKLGAIDALAELVRPHEVGGDEPNRVPGPVW